MNYKELSGAFKKIISWYKKKTKVLNIKSRPYNTGFVFFDLISRIINDDKKVLYIFCTDAEEIKGKDYAELYNRSIQKIMPGKIEELITFISIEEISEVGDEYSLIIFDDITMFSKYSVGKIRDAVEKIYWKVNKIIIYSCEKVFPIGEKMDLVYLLNPIPMIEPRFLNTRIKLEDDIPLAVYEYVKWFKYNNKNVIIIVPSEEKVNKVYDTYKNHLKIDNARVVKYLKGESFANIEEIIKNESIFIVTNNIGNYINKIEDVNMLVLFGDDISYSYKKIVCLCGCINVKSDILPEVLIISRDVSLEMDKAKEIIRGFNKKLWEKKLLR